MKYALYPEKVVEPELPTNYELAKAFCEDGLKYKTREVCRYELKNTLVFPNGLIFTPFQLFSESVVHEEFIKNYNRSYFFKKIAGRTKKRKIRILPFRNNYFSFFDEWTSNHYHFHAEFLPRLLFVNPAELNETSLVLPDTPYIKATALSVLKLFNFNFRNIHFIKSDEICFIHKLTYISKTVSTGLIHSDLLHQLKNRLAVNQNKKNISERMYVKRNNASARKVLNEAEVESVLTEQYGFTPVDFGDYSFEEQVQLASQVKLMVGMHGAGLTNLMYMPANGKVVEFRRRGIHHNHCYWHLASSVGISYSVVFGHPDDESKVLEGNGCNLFIDIAELRKTLDRLIE